MRYQKSLSTCNVSEWCLKKTGLSVIDMMGGGIPPSSSDSTMTSKNKKNNCATFKIEMKIHCLYHEAWDDALFKNRSKQSAFVLRSLKAMLNHEMDRLSPQKLEYEMERADLPDD